MALQPTTHWLKLRAEESDELADGTLAEEDTYLAQSFPDELIEAVADVQTEFEDSVHDANPRDISVAATALREAVLALNAIHQDFDDAAFETDDREVICTYFDEILEEHGIDLDELAHAIQGDRNDISEVWRTW